MDISAISIKYYIDEIASIDGKKIFAGESTFSTKLNRRDHDIPRVSNENAYPALYDVVRKYGYSDLNSRNIANMLLPLYWKINFSNPDDVDSVRRDLSDSIDSIGKFIYNEKGGFKSESIQLYLLFLDNDPNFEKLIDKLYHGQASDRFARILFECTYHSLLGSIILEAKGLQVDALYLEDFTNLYIFLYKNTKNMPDDLSHVNCLAMTTDKKALFVDFLHKWISKPFVLDEEYHTKDHKEFTQIINDPTNGFVNSFEILEKRSLIGKFFFNLATVSFRSNNYEFAIYFSRKAVSLDPHDLNAISYLAAAYKELKEYDKAISVNLEVLGSADQNIKVKLFACIELGHIYSLKDDPEESASYYKKAIGFFNEILLPRGSEYFNVAQAYISIKDYFKAITALEEYQSRKRFFNNKKIDQKANFQLASLYRREFKDYKKALRLIQKTPDNPTPDMYILIGDCCLGLFDYPKARENYYKAKGLLEEQGDFEKVRYVEDFITQVPY